MYARNKWWILGLVALIVTASACTSNDLDESEADSVLEVLSINNPSVTGTIEFVCLIAGNECLSPDDCPADDSCVPGPSSGCLVAEWSASVANKALNEGGVATPFNDIVVTSVTISYTNADGSMYAPTRTIPASATIPAGATGTVSFLPILFEDLTTGPATISLGLDFNAESVAGNDVETAGLGGDVLAIECAGAVPVP